MRKKQIAFCLVLAMALSLGLGACSSASDDKIHINMVQYKPEAVAAFETIQQKFNATHENIVLEIESPNDTLTVLKTRFIKDKEPDIIGIGGDVNFSSFLDADMIMDISDFDGLTSIKSSYLAVAKNLEYVPLKGIYSVPYAANAAGILYNKDMFREHGWEIPTTWEELTALCGEIKDEGILPFYFGFKDVWTCLAPWNAMAVDLAPADICQQVNKGNTTFREAYREVAEKMLDLLPYGPGDPFAYSYNDACTAFANGESAMYPIGNYAVPQIQSVNPAINIGSFVMPGSSDPGENVLNSGIDLQFCVMASTENKEAAYEVLSFLLEDDTVQVYLDDQSAVPCKEGDFQLPEVLDGVASYIEAGRIADYQDHYYPSEMSVDAKVQTLLITGDADRFLSKFDEDWTRYNRDIIRKVQEYEEKGGQ